MCNIQYLLLAISVLFNEQIFMA